MNKLYFKKYFLMAFCWQMAAHCVIGQYRGTGKKVKVILS